MAQKRIFCSDVLKKLKTIPDSSVTLIYLDPPFFLNKRLEATSNDGITNGFDDKWENNLKLYLDFMTNVLLECHRILKKNGSIYLHCDWHAVHYLRIELDNIFGMKKFRNEIIWRRHNAHNDTIRCLGRINDVILFYAKGYNNIFNQLYANYDDLYIKKTYKYVEEGTNRRYALGDLTGPGGGAKSNPRYKFLGFTRYWRFHKKKMQRLLLDGKIIQTSKKTVPKIKRYLDEMKGVPLQNIWHDIEPVSKFKKEWRGYPTQKPLRLLERIIQISSNPKDTVLDPFCGSGTTLVAASNLGRKFIGIDRNPAACKIARLRVNRKNIKKKKISKGRYFLHIRDNPHQI